MILSATLSLLAPTPAFAQPDPVVFDIHPSLEDKLLPPEHLPLTTDTFSCALVAATRGGTGPFTPDQVPGMGELRLEIRRRKVSLVTVVSTSPGLDPYMPCITRELASIPTRVRRADLVLRVEPSDPEPEPGPEPTTDQP